ncbi:MAG: hypothetical protein Q8S40_05740 [Falsiroseomonas sp.]|nr:hypothetical protein [Falsiroseomonas sp.]MDP3415465.1 hypothetical protein [Falsiroseomonas sp.]
MINDSQLWHLLRNQRGLIISACHAAAGRRVFEPAPAIPDQLADIEPVSQDPGLSPSLPPQSPGRPKTAAWSRQLLGIKLTHQRNGAASFCELLENPAHHRRLCEIDLPQPALGLPIPIDRAADHSITVGETAAAASLAHPALQASPGFIGQILEIQRTHSPFEADMQFADLTLGQGQDADACELCCLMEARHVLLVATQPVEAFREHQINPARAHGLQ